MSQRKRGQKSLKNRRFDSAQNVGLGSQKNYLLSSKVNKTWKREKGPFTRGQRRQSQPNTRSMGRLDIFRKLKFICGCCADSVSPVNPVNREKFARHHAAPKSKPHFVKKFRNKNSTNIGNIKNYLTLKVKQGYNGKRGKARMANGCWSECGMGRDPVKRAPRDVLSAAPTPAQSRAAAWSVSSKLSNFGEYFHLLPFGVANSKSTVKPVAAYGCHPCGDCTYSEHTPKKLNTVGRPLHKSESFGHEKSLVKVENTVTKVNKIILWEDHYPKVTLCDIGSKCVECSHKCSFVLSDFIKSKPVHCLAEEMRAGFRFEPGCLVQKKHSINESVPVKNNRFDSEQNAYWSANTNEQNRDLINNTDPGAVSSNFLGEWESNGSASCSFTAHETPKELCVNDIKDKCTKASQNLLREEPYVKIMNIAFLSDHSYLENSSCMDPLKNDYRLNDTLASVNCVDIQSKPDSQVRDSFAHREVCGPIDLGGGFRGQSSELNGPMLDNLDELDSFTCQRVRVYSGKMRFSCARTYLTWPFSSSKRNSTEPAGNGDSNAGHISPSQNHQSAVTNGSSEPTIPAQLTQQWVSVSNQVVEGEEKNKICECAAKKTDNCIGVSSDMKNKNKYPSHSCQHCLSPRQGSKETNDSPPSNNDGARSTPFPSELGLTDSETGPTIFAVNANGSLSSLSNSPFLLTTSSPNISRLNLSQLASTDSLDSNDSSKSSLLLPQDVEASLDETITSRSPPKLEPFYKTRPFIHKLTNAFGNNTLLYTGKCIDTDLFLPPLLSPLNSPQKHIVAKSTAECENHTEMHTHEMLSESHTPESGNEENCAYNHSCHQRKAFATNNDVHKIVVLGNEEAQQHPLDSDIMASPASEALTGSCFSPSSDENEELESDESSREEESNSSEMEEKKDDAEKTAVLDEIKAYEQDILLVDVIQDDPDLFEKVPPKSLLKLGPVRAGQTPETGRKKMVKILPPAPESAKLKQSFTPVNIDFLRNSPSTTEDSPRRPWRPQCNSTSSALQSSTNKQTKIMGQAGGRIVNAEEERAVHIPAANLSHNHISTLMTMRMGLRITNIPGTTDVRWQKPAYCRNYFSESLNCGFKVCRFHHVPLDGDEKFCIEAVVRFAKNPACLYKAGAVFTGYYQNNPPGTYFSMPVLLSLLWALLKAGMLSDLFSVLKTSLAHNIVPEHEFLLDLFNFIREKNLMSFVPELMQLTFKMAGAGLPLSLDCLDCVKNTPELHQTVSSSSPAANSANNRSTTLPEYLNLAHAVVEIVLCTKQEDWKRLGEVFRSICQSTQQVNQVERISGRIAVALLSESKDKLSLPFAAFAETACQNVDEDSPVKSFLGRIGVSLMLRYHKTHQWAKGQKVVEVLSAAKVSYATMKGLFGNEDGTSRCHLVSVATEFFLLNGSVEGALNTLRENEWFLTSSMWPCEPSDMEKRTRVLLHLAEKTSHRDTLEVLSNLPGLKEPNGHIDISRYTPFFTSHLQVCIDRQVLLLASDLVDFMLSKRLPVDHAMLQMLLHKLGKQNLWLRAREIFRHSVNKGYYPGVSAPFGLMTLMVPSQLGEIELALTFEMFITVNATAIVALPESTTSTMTITLKRTKSCESDYLSAGSRLLSAACIPQPKLSVHYTAVNSSQEQVFSLDISSARRWLRHNHLWANEVWTLST